jgi:succinoglycan biosynthesis protein ExoM
MHISVCVCTYKRPVLLARLLAGLISQATGGLFSYSIIVVDNDRRRSAENAVFSCKKNSKVSIEYLVEERQNVALARNKAIDNAKGELIALMDDDDFPSQDWLLNLFMAFQKSACSGVIGRISYKFNGVVSGWVKKISFFNLKYKTGAILNRDMYTGNCLLDRRLFSSGNNYFLPELGEGGEDAEFFYRMRKLGHNFIWCNEAVVYAPVPPERLRLKWLLRRALRYGIVDFKIKTQERAFLARFMAILKSFLFSLALLLLMPFTLIRGKHKFYDCLFAAVSCAGFFLGNFGYSINEYKAELPTKNTI